MKSAESIFLTVCRCAVSCGALVLYVYGYVCFQRTIVGAWPAALLIAAPALLTLPMLCKRWRWLTGIESGGVNAVCHIYVAGALWSFLLMGGNWLLADPSTAYTERVTVERKIRREHKRYQRITQHSVRVVGVYHTYHLQILFDDGTRKAIPVSLADYNRTRTNGPRQLPMRIGFFGLPVVAAED